MHALGLGAMLRTRGPSRAEQLLETSAKNAESPVQTVWSYRCGACGFANDAWVEGFSGKEPPVSSVGVEPADENAARAWKDARALVAIAPCPKCGARSDDAMRTVLRARTGPSLTWGLLGGFVGLVAMCVMRSSPDVVDAIAGALVAAVVAIAAFVIGVQKRVAATRKVRFRNTGTGSTR